MSVCLGFFLNTVLEGGREAQQFLGVDCGCRQRTKSMWEPPSLPRTGNSALPYRRAEAVVMG